MIKALSGLICTVLVASGQVNLSGKANVSGKNKMAHADLIAADLFLGITGTDASALTTNILDASTHGSGGHWRVQGLNGDDIVSAANFTVTNWNNSFKTPVVVGGTTYFGTGVKSLFYDNSQGNRKASYVFNSDHSNVVVSAFVTFGPTSATDKFFDHIVIEALDGSGQFCVCNQRTTQGVRAHGSFGGSSGYGPNITVTANKLYWVTLYYHSGDACYLKIYDPADGSLTGSSTFTLDATGGGARYVGFGDNYSDTQSVGTTFGNLIINWTAPVFPLGP